MSGIHTGSTAVSPAFRSDRTLMAQIRTWLADTFQSNHSKVNVCRIDYLRHLRTQTSKVWNEILSAGLR